MIWVRRREAFTWKSVSSTMSLQGRINSQDYLRILSDQVYSMLAELLRERRMFQDDNAPVRFAEKHCSVDENI